MKFSVFALSLIVTTFLFSSCSPKNSEMIVAEYGNYNITLDEYKEAYAKSVGGMEAAKDDSLEQLKTYLDLYVNYKMKLRDAQVRGYDVDEELNAELDEYKHQIGKSYIEEKFVVQPGIKQLYEDDKIEYKFQHILIKPDTISRKEASEFAYSLIERIKNGEDFGELAKKYSADFASKDVDGEIYYIRPTQIPMVQLTDILKKSTPGQVYHKPFMSAAGYHVVRLISKKPVRYKIRVSHIIRDFKNDAGEPDTANALEVIKAVKFFIEQGQSFDSLAVFYSEDPGSKMKGGDLGFFPRRSMVIAFDSVVFNLKVGEISDIVKTNFGFHIAKCTGEMDYPPIEELNESLSQFYKKNIHAQRMEQYKDELKEQFSFKVNDKLFDYIKADNIKTFFDEEIGESSVYKSIKDITAFSFKDRTFSAGEVMDFSIQNKNNTGKIVDSSFVANLINTYSGKILFDLKLEDLEKNDDEFKSLLDEYRNGILIFRLQEEEVWSNVTLDSTGMKAFFNENSEKYNWADRVSYKQIFTTSDSLSNLIINKLNEGEGLDSLFVLYNEKSPKIESKCSIDLVEVNKNAITQQANKLKNIGDYSNPFRFENGWIIVQLVDRDKARAKTFEEAKGECIGPYQEFLSKKAEKDYIEKLNSIYNPKKYYDLLWNAIDKSSN
ncbi:MAG: peptidylprolyl isomerase [Bacteroidetes bacterium]|nr:peptidylprolyl isomerase [Bacteroidota bacterium]